MRVIQVVSGNLPIEATGERRWGAVELIQYEYKKHLNNLGVECEIKWLNDIEKDFKGIVHIHVANLCLEAKKRGIPYIYSNHDHTSAHLGRGSWLYNMQLEAIKGSVFSICHAESVVSFFRDTDKLFYLQHGVDTSFYQPSLNLREKRLLMIASNGMAGDSGIDRKGFRYGIEAAKKLNMPITIVGTEANKHFFEIHKDLSEYELLTIDSSNPKEIDKLKYYQSHSIFLHPSSLEFGSPNLTLLEAWACGIPTIAAYDGRVKLDGLLVLNRLDVNEICEKIEYAYANYDSIVSQMTHNRERHDWEMVVAQLYRMYQAHEAIKNVEDTETIKHKYTQLYGKAD